MKTTPTPVVSTTQSLLKKCAKSLVSGPRLALGALALHAGGAVPFCAIRFDCGCGGGEVAICRKLVENTILFGMAVGVVRGSRQA